MLRPARHTATQSATSARHLYPSLPTPLWSLHPQLTCQSGGHANLFDSTPQTVETGSKGIRAYNPATCAFCWYCWPLQPLTCPARCPVPAAMGQGTPRGQQPSQSPGPAEQPPRHHCCCCQGLRDQIGPTGLQGRGLLGHNTAQRLSMP